MTRQMSQIPKVVKDDPFEYMLTSHLDSQTIPKSVIKDDRQYHF